MTNSNTNSTPAAIYSKAEADAYEAGRNEGYGLGYDRGHADGVAKGARDAIARLDLLKLSMDGVRLYSGGAHPLTYVNDFRQFLAEDKLPWDTAEETPST